MSYTTTEIARLLGVSVPEADINVSILLTDSRSLTYPAQSMFFAITTPNNDGHRYISDLYEKGVRAFCVTHIPEEMTDRTDATMIVVDDVTKALQKIGKHHRDQFRIPIIAITGSKGKTTVKEWLYQLLKADFNIVRSPRSYNSKIGVPLSIWGISDDTRLGIFEAGISQSGEMQALETIISPTIGILTNIGHEHDEGFSSMVDKCREKIRLFRNCKCVVFNADDDLIAAEIKRSDLPGALLGWSTSDPAQQLYISSRHETDDSTEIEYHYLGQKHHITLPFTGDERFNDAMPCLATMLYLNIDAATITTRMKALKPTGTRLEVIEGVNDCMLIHDSYTSDFNSLAPAIDFMMRRSTPISSTTVILSDVMHETGSPAKVYQRVAELLRQKGVDRMIGIGEEITANSKYFDSNSTFYPSTSEFLAQVSPGDFDNELILIKGAPQFHFDMVCDMLEARQHETILEVNLDAMVHNFNLFRSLIKPTTGIVCMVKAYGYGAGSYELAKTLQSQGAAYLAVAVLDEGVELRKRGITMPIMVLNPKVVNYKTLFAYNLEPEIFSFDILDELIREGEKYGITDYPVHIKLDTGMHRLGFIESELPKLVETLRRQKVVRPCSIFSHLAAADDPSMDDYTMSQFELFDRCCDTIQRAFPYHIMRHILNSTGIDRFPEHQHDMVRLGIGLYGIPTLNDANQKDLRRVSSLYTTVISVRQWPAGTSIGYNRRGILTRDSKIATIPVGYADGIDRHLGNGNMHVWVNGHRCPSVGNICMDACMIDVTDTDCKVGDIVEIFGDHIAPQELADTLGTIPYEILTSVSTRVKRVYYRE